MPEAEEARNGTDLSSEGRSLSPNECSGHTAYNNRRLDICLLLGFEDMRTLGDPCHYKQNTKRKEGDLTRRLAFYTLKGNAGLIHTLYTGQARTKAT